MHFQNGRCQQVDGDDYYVLVWYSTGAGCMHAVKIVAFLQCIEPCPHCVPMIACSSACFSTRYEWLQLNEGLVLADAWHASDVHVAGRCGTMPTTAAGPQQTLSAMAVATSAVTDRSNISAPPAPQSGLVFSRAAVHLM
jgi:hypothetical protein